MNSTIEELYLNKMQMMAQIIDPNILIVEGGRGVGKTEGITGPRTIRVANDLTRETSVIGHKTYVALLSNIVPNLLSYYNTPRGSKERPLLQEGRDYVVGRKDLPSHFEKPRYPIQHPEHTICYANGHNIRLVSTDQPESIAGGNIVHIFGEELKHNKGDKFKTRIIPAMRVGRLSKGASVTYKSPYYQGMTLVTDTARTSLGEDDWFTSYEQNVNKELISDIASLSLHVNEAMLNIQLGKNVQAMQKRIDKYMPILRKMRSYATLYIRVSSFVNREVLGKKYFETQSNVLSPEEFITAIGSVRERKVADLFLAAFDEEKHTYSDSYIYDNIMKFNLNDTFKLTGSYLKYWDKSKPLELGYDPGAFASLLVAQPRKIANEYRIIKEFWTAAPDDIPELARKFSLFFEDKINKKIDLYYDRAGNKKANKKAHKSDAMTLKSELEKFGWRVRLMNEGQRVIYFWEHYKLNMRLFNPDTRSIPKMLIDANECPNLISSIFHAPIKKGSNPIELDKSSERLPLYMQPHLSTQIMSAYLYLLFGKFSKFLSDSGGSATAMPL